ncbi:MAG: hypothetical protein RSD51_03365 [Malacoplasma sp.]
MIIMILNKDEIILIELKNNEQLLKYQIANLKKMNKMLWEKVEQQENEIYRYIEKNSDLNNNLDRANGEWKLLYDENKRLKNE